MPVKLELYWLIRKSFLGFSNKKWLTISYSKIHILGSFQNIKIARDAVVSLILGSPPGKVYATLRTISARMKERF
jgi:RNA-binding protein PNO1